MNRGTQAAILYLLMLIVTGTMFGQPKGEGRQMIGWLIALGLFGAGIYSVSKDSK